jgi:FAD/FMN-containing dehydrogenase
MDDFNSVSGFLQFLQRELADSLSAFEIMWGDYYAAVTGDNGHRAPLSRDYGFYVVFESEGSNPEADANRFEEVLQKALTDELIVDAVMPKSESESRTFWEIRENFEDILVPEPVYLYDVSLPIRDMDAYVEKVRANVAARWTDGQCYVIGHVADGNLHLFVRPLEQGDLRRASDECVYEPLAEIGGSVSAEHGIGTEKINWLPHSRSEAEIDLMRSLKSSFDRNNILNPGRVILL